MTVCAPVKDLKNTAEFTRLVNEASEPVMVTTNGKVSFVAMSPEEYDALRAEGALSRLYQVLDRAEEDVAAGNWTDARETVASLKERYGL